MKNKKIITFLMILVLLIGGIIMVNNIYQNKNKINKTKRKKQNNLAIMIKEDGASDYTKSSSNDMPIGNYVLNEEKTHCENNGKILSYDNTTGKVKFSFVGSDRCYLYFDFNYNNKIDLLGQIIYLDTKFSSTGTPSTKYLVTNENGIRYEGADPNNYICLDNKTNGTCLNSSLLFRIIGLFDEDTSSDGTTSSGSKKLLKVIDTNNYGGTDGKCWDDEINRSNWSISTLKKELNETYLSALTGTVNVNSKLNSTIANAKWHLGGVTEASYLTLTVDDYYKEERNISAIYDDNPSSIYAKVGLMYPSDYGYATLGGTTTSKTECRAKALFNYDTADCKNNNWLFISQKNFVEDGEWFITPSAENADAAVWLYSDGAVDYYLYDNSIRSAVRPTFYLDSSMLKIVGGTGTSSDPYHIG